MAFSDPSSGFYSPSTPNTGSVDTPSLRLQPLPDLQNIGSPTRQPFEKVSGVRYQPDETVGTGLAAGVQALKAAVEGTDSAIKLTLGNEVHKEANAILNQQIQAGLDTKDELLSEGSKGSIYDKTPNELANGFSKLSTMKKANRSGDLNDTDFLVRANKLKTEMTARFPGYANWVDGKFEQEFSSVPGMLRKSLQKDIDTLQKAKAETTDYWTKKFVDNQNDLPKNWRDRTVSQNLSTMQDVQSERQARVDDKAIMEQQQNHGVHPWQTASNSITRDGIQFGARAMNMVREEVERQGVSFDKVFNGQGTPQQNEITLHALQTINRQWNTAFDQRATVDTYDETQPGLTVFNIMRSAGKASELDDIKKRSNPIQPFIDSLVGKDNKDTGIAFRQSRILEGVINARTAQIVTSNRDYLDHVIHSKQLGPAYNTMLASDTNRLFALSKAINEVGNQRVIDPRSPFSETIDWMHTQYEMEHGKGTKPSAGEINQKMDIKLNILSTDIPDKEAQAAHFRSVYSDPNMGKFLQGIVNSPNGVNDAPEVFGRFINPSITQRALQQPEDIKQDYFKFAETMGSRVLPGLASDIKDRAVKNAYYDVAYDKATSSFVTVPTELGRKNPQAYDQSVNGSAWYNPFTKSEGGIKRMNATLQSMKPIIEATGRDFNEYVASAPYLMAIDKPEKVKGGFFPGVNEQATIRENARSNYNQKTQPTGANPLINLIVKGEADGSYDPANFDKGYKGTTKTIGQVIEDQGNHLKTRTDDKVTTAAGGPQFIKETLERSVKETGMSLDTPFNEQTQNKLAKHLVKGAGLAEFRSGNLSEDEFADKLAKVWASLPLKTGKSNYAGDKQGNKARVSRTELLTAIRATNWDEFD